MTIHQSEVEKVARLAQLGLSPEELGRAATDLGRLLGYIEQILAIDADDAPETVHVGDAATPLRPDIARPGLARELVTAAAPAAAAGLFEVPRVIARGGKPGSGAPGGELDGDEVAP